MASDHVSAVALLLPGMTLNGTSFPDLGCPVVAPDFSAFAPWSEPVLSGENPLRPYLDRVDALLTQSADWRSGRPRVIVGHSFGGMLAMAWLLRHQGDVRHRVDGLVLIATTAGPMYGDIRIRLGPIRIPIGAVWKLWNRRSVTEFVKRRLSGGSLDAERVDFRALVNPTDRAVDRAGWRNTSAAAMRSYRLAMDGFDVRAEVHRIKVPTIVIHGTRDPLFRLSTARGLASGIPNARLVTVHGAGHALPVTHHEHVKRAVGDVFAGTAR